MKKKKLIIVILVVAVFSSMLTSLLYLSLKEKFELIGAEDIQTINMELLVGDRIGLNADTDMLNFGIIMPGSSVRRSINVTNTHPYNISVKLFKKGNISRFISFQQDSIVEPNTSKSIVISAGVPLNTSFESYSGQLKVAFFSI